MTARFQNRLKRILYRPAKKRPHMDFLAKKLGEAEKALDATVGGLLGNKRNKRRKKTPRDDCKKK